MSAKPSIIARLSPWLTTLVVVLSFVAAVPLLLPLALLLRTRQRPWVFGGHRGRLYADNSGALHDYLHHHVGVSMVWIASDDALLAELSRQGKRALKMHSLAARWHILLAPVVVYSHGESDLDLCLCLLRRVLGFRVYLNHSMNYLKAGEYHNQRAERLRGPAKWLFHWLVTDFDLLLANSPLEADNFALSYPHQRRKIALGGGAHLDHIFAGRNAARTGTIFYFPTFREDEASRIALAQVIDRLASDARLADYLARKGWKLCVGAHINAAAGLAHQSHVEWVAPHDVLSAFFACDVFISDYSGLVLDYLVLEKPIVHFPFDLSSYLACRRLYVDLNDLAYGPMAQDVDHLIEVLVSEAWRPQPCYLERAEFWRKQVLVHRQPIYSADTYQAILRELQVRAPKYLPENGQALTLTANGGG